MTTAAVRAELVAQLEAALPAPWHVYSTPVGAPQFPCVIVASPRIDLTSQHLDGSAMQEWTLTVGLNPSTIADSFAAWDALLDSGALTSVFSTASSAWKHAQLTEVEPVGITPEGRLEASLSAIIYPSPT